MKYPVRQLRQPDLVYHPPLVDGWPAPGKVLSPINGIAKGDPVLLLEVVDTNRHYAFCLLSNGLRAVVRLDATQRI